MLRHFYTNRKAFPERIKTIHFTNSYLDNRDKPKKQKFQTDFLGILNNSLYICIKKKRTLNQLLKLKYGQLIAHTQLYWNICVVNCTYNGVMGNSKKLKRFNYN